MKALIFQALSLKKFWTLLNYKTGEFFVQPTIIGLWVEGEKTMASYPRSTFLKIEKTGTICMFCVPEEVLSSFL